MNIDHQELRTQLKLSAQRALLGMIYPSIRGIAIGSLERKTFKIIVYLDRPPTVEDFENVSDIAGEILADMNFVNTEEKCEFITAPISKLDKLDFWAYVRKESSLMRELKLS